MFFTLSYEVCCLVTCVGFDKVCRILFDVIFIALALAYLIKRLNDFSDP